MSWLTQPVDLQDERPWIALVHIDENKEPEVAAYINRNEWSVILDSFDEIQKAWERHLEF